MSNTIHPSAVVDPKAELAGGVTIGPLCVIGSQVKIGKNTRLDSHVNIAGDTQIGDDCELSPFVSLGHPPQDFKHRGGPVSLKIGNRTKLRENVNIHPGTDTGRPETVVGDDCYFMVNTHLAHEGRVGNNVVVSNGAQIGGCVTIEDNAILSGLCAIHQYTRIGAYAFVGGGAIVTTDVIPYGSVVGNFAHLAGLNIIGLKRRGFSRKEIGDLRAAYRLMFAAEGTFKERRDDAQRLYGDNALVREILNFVDKKDKRPICMPHTGG